MSLDAVSSYYDNALSNVSVYDGNAQAAISNSSSDATLFEGEVESAKSSAEGLSNAAVTAKEMAEAIDANIQANKTSQQEANSLISSTNESLTRTQTSISGLEAQLGGLDKEADDYQTQYNAIQQQITEKQAALSELQTTLSTAQQELATLEEQEGQLNESAAALETFASQDATSKEAAIKDQYTNIIVKAQSNDPDGSGAGYSSSEQGQGEQSGEQAQSQADYYSQTGYEPAGAQVSDATGVPGESEEDISSIKAKIEKNDKVDEDMADFICKNFFDNDFLLDIVDDIIGFDAKDAVDTVAEAAKAEEYSNSVYSTKVSANTDTATIDENQTAISDFRDAYSELDNKLSADDAQIDIASQSNYELISSFADRLNNNEYILTREIEKATSTAETIQVNTVENTDEKEQTAKANGDDLLARLRSAITDDIDAPEDDTDEILTQKEYEKMENFFETNNDFVTSYETLVKDAEQYGIYATAA